MRQELETEAQASAEFARHSPFPAPRPAAIGAPGSGYPLPWSVQTWLSGTVASGSGSGKLAGDLAELIMALRAVSAGGRRFTGTSSPLTCCPPAKAG
jgi:aminoglycoside phosphotransferase (APT) family kinase protein